MIKEEFKLDNQLCFRLYTASRLITQTYHPLLSQCGLTYPQYLVLLVFEYDDKVVEIHLDYFGRVRNRQTELYTEDDVIVVDFNKESCELKAQGVVENYGADDRFYQNEMAYFMDLYLSKGTEENINSPEAAYETLRITKGFI